MDMQEMVNRLDWLLRESPGPDNAWVPLRRADVIQVQGMLRQMLGAAGALRDVLRLVDGQQEAVALPVPVVASVNGNGVHAVDGQQGTQRIRSLVLLPEDSEWQGAVSALENGDTKFSDLHVDGQMAILRAILRRVEATADSVSYLRFYAVKPSYVPTDTSLKKMFGCTWSQLVERVLASPTSTKTGGGVVVPDSFR